MAAATAASARPPSLSAHARQASSPEIEFSGDVGIEFTVVAVEINLNVVPTYRAKREIELEAHFKNKVLFTHKQSVESPARSTWNESASLTATAMQDVIVFYINGEPRLFGSIDVKTLLVDVVNDDLSLPKWVLLSLRNKPDAKPGAVRVQFKVLTEQTPKVVASANHGHHGEHDTISARMLTEGVALLTVDNKSRTLHHSDLPEPLDLFSVMSQADLPGSTSNAAASASGGSLPEPAAAAGDGGGGGAKKKTKGKGKASSPGRASKGSIDMDPSKPQFATIPHSGHTVEPVALSKKAASTLAFGSRSIAAPPSPLETHAPAPTPAAGPSVSDLNAGRPSDASSSMTPLLLVEPEGKPKKPKKAGGAAAGKAAETASDEAGGVPALAITTATPAATAPSTSPKPKKKKPATPENVAATAPATDPAAGSA